MTEIQKDLFGNVVKPKNDDLEMELSFIDDEAFESRLKRFRYLDQIFEFSNDCQFGDCSGIGPVTKEMSLLFEEARMVFVDGAFISTILLCQAFVEHWLKDYLSQQKKLSRNNEKSLYSMLKLCRDDGLLHPYFTGKIDDIRKRRNPIIHPQQSSDYSISQGIVDAEINMDDLLMSDAKIAIEIMHAIIDI